MKTLIVTIGGPLTPGDQLFLEYTHPQRGGTSTLKVKVLAPVDEIVDDGGGTKRVSSTADSIASIIQRFLDQMAQGQAWPPSEFVASGKDSTSFVVKCRGEHGFADIAFKVFAEGVGGKPATETIGLQVL